MSAEKWVKKGNAKTVEEVFLQNMQVNSTAEINEWFKKSYAHDYKINDLMKAVEFAKTFKDKPVLIAGDYDGDGITATSIMYLALKWAGFKKVSYRIPKKFSEGFGINMNTVDSIDDGLIITVDNGIAQVDVINTAKAKGLSVIVIDHHLPTVDEKDNIPLFPEADFIIDPPTFEGSSDFDGYCGAGLAFKFACELLGYEDKVKISKLQTLAAIGTITDVMDLREENYVIVKNAMKMMSNQLLCTKGLWQLLSTLNMTTTITSHDIAFSVGPTINAGPRMNDDGATEVVKLLIEEDDYMAARVLAEKLKLLNDERKKIQKEALEIAQEKVAECYGEIPLVIFLPDVKEGIIGIVAGKIAEQTNVPTFCLTNTEEGIIKGSGRSCGNYNMKAELDKCQGLLLKYGGHVGAAGLSVKEDDFDLLKKTLQDNCTGYECEQNDSFYNLEISVKDIPLCLEQLSKYEPWGHGNPSPVFKINDFSLTQKYGKWMQKMGTDKSTVKLFGKVADAIGFGFTDIIEYEGPVNFELLGSLSYNYYKGNASNQIEFSDYITL